MKKVLLSFFSILFFCTSAFAVDYIPSPACVDQGSTSSGCTKALLNAIGVSKDATLKFKHSSGGNTTTYTFTTSTTIPANVLVDIEYGAILSGSVTYTKASIANNVTTDIAMNTHKLTGLSAPISNGDSIRATTKITESSLESANDLKHTQNTDTGTSSLTWSVGDTTDSDIYFYALNADANKPYLHYNKTSNKWFFSNDGSAEIEMSGPLSPTFATAAEDLANVESAKNIAPLTNPQLIKNIKYVVNAAVNKLDIKTQSGDAIPDASNAITIAIPDGTGNTYRRSTGAYLSGTFQFVLGDATAYWGATSTTDKLKLHLYAIYDANGGIVFALSRYSGFHQVPTTTTVGDDDYFLLEASSTYTRAATDFCVCIGEVWANYNTANTPDWTIYQESDGAEFAPQVIWNPPSDYGYSKNLASTVTSAGEIPEYSAISVVVKQSGRYSISASVQFYAGAASIYGAGSALIKTGSATYGSAVLLNFQRANSRPDSISLLTAPIVKALNAGDTIHLGITYNQDSGNRVIRADDYNVGCTHLEFHRVD